MYAMVLSKARRSLGVPEIVTRPTKSHSPRRTGQKSDDDLEHPRAILAEILGPMPH
jgi:hypothetical protein